MSENLSLKLKDDIFRETEKIIEELEMPRNAYINDAVDFYNRLMKRKLLKTQMVRESQAVYRTSLDVLKEYEKLEDEIPE